MRKVVFEQPPTLEVLYQDEHIVAINKPSGLLVHRSEIDKRETLFALQLTRDLISQRVYPIHRLDRPTSGVLVFALSSDVARMMSEQFIAHAVTKRYLAVVRGYVPKTLTIDYALKEILDKFADKDRAQDKEPQQAVTELQSLATAELPFPSGRYPQSRYSLVELTPATGRKHQLRRHMAHIRHPILGDTNHGDGKQNKAALDNLNLDRLALHAKSIEFTHPITNKSVFITAGLDKTMTELFERCDWHQYIN
ncbi:MAG: tRNA pseudouridine(65) synthase TruC [Gammaproteobacteria bacterium]|nr:tRNA pseudouridine(65) synthase TruC [Gammaproteobacteria bacterium]